MLKYMNSGTIIAAAGIIYVIAMFLLDWNGTAVVVGALMVGLVAVLVSRSARQSS